MTTTLRNHLPELTLWLGLCRGSALREHARITHARLGVTQAVARDCATDSAAIVALGAGGNEVGGAAEGGTPANLAQPPMSAATPTTLSTAEQSAPATLPILRVPPVDIIFQPYRGPAETFSRQPRR